jgi:hypothetical protein
MIEEPRRPDLLRAGFYGLGHYRTTTQIIGLSDQPVQLYQPPALLLSRRKPQRVDISRRRTQLALNSPLIRWQRRACRPIVPFVAILRPS